MSTLTVCKVIGTLDFGGIEKVFALCGKYNKRHKLVFIGLGKGGATSSYLSSLGYEVHVLGADIQIPNVSLIWRLYSMFRKIRPDVVHTTGAEANFHGLVAGWMAGVPVRVGEEIGMPSHSRLARKVFQFVYSRSSAMIAVAKSVAAYMLESGEVRTGNLRVIYNPVDVDAFLGGDEVVRQSENFVILSVCRLHPIKNLKALVRVFVRLSKNYKNTRLWIVGDGPDRKELESLIEVSGVKDLVTMYGYQDNPARFFKSANVFVLPSFSEGHPVSLVEAMVSEIPVVATRVGGAVEIITDAENGWLIDPLSDDDIYDKIEKVMRLPKEESAVMLKRSRQQAVESFSPEEYLSSLDNLYRSLL